MVLCDTNIFINAFNGRQDTITQLDKIGLNDIVLSAIAAKPSFAKLKIIPTQRKRSGADHFPATTPF